MLRIEIQTRELVRALIEAQRRSSNASPAFREAGAVLTRSVQRNFASEGRPEKWQPVLDARTMARRKRRRKRGKTLDETGRLARSIHAEVDPLGVTVGSDLPYAAIHQFGGKAGRGQTVTITPRPYLIVQPDDEREIASVIESHLAEPLR